jgi:hypothetical protein
MGQTLKFTQSAFTEARLFTTATTANVSYDILSGNTLERRVYGISFASTDAGAQTIKIYLNDGSLDYQLFTYSLAANAGNSTTIAAADIFGDSKVAPVFQKQRDSNGVPYFNLPVNWSIRAQYGTALATTETIISIVFGEVY